MAAMALWAAVLITYGVSTGITMDSTGAGSNTVIQLDMAPDSIDDMYDGCKDKMKAKVEAEYLQNERNANSRFKEAWDMAEKYDKQKWKRKKGKRPSTALGKEQAVAIYVYTLDEPNVYLDFNNAVRTQKSQYKTTFSYHTLHFFLTDAIQMLNARKPKEERCVTAYRRVDSYFSQDVLNKEIRFGSFTSSSLGSYPNPRFGVKSCFKIVTCLGADITLYSKHGESEREVLIPPYEVFKVIEIKTGSDHKSLPCYFVYELKSTEEALSDINCTLFGK